DHGRHVSSFRQGCSGGHTQAVWHGHGQRAMSGRKVDSPLCTIPAWQRQLTTHSPTLPERVMMSTQRTRFSRSSLSRRRFAGLSAAALGGATMFGTSTPAAAQSMDPFTYIRTMPETETLGQRAGQPVDEVGPVE